MLVARCSSASDKCSRAYSIVQPIARCRKTAQGRIWRPGVSLTARFLPKLGAGRFVALRAHRSERLWLLVDQVGRAQTTWLPCVTGRSNRCFCSICNYLPAAVLAGAVGRRWIGHFAGRGRAGDKKSRHDKLACNLITAGRGLPNDGVASSANLAAAALRVEARSHNASQHKARA